MCNCSYELLWRKHKEMVSQSRTNVDFASFLGKGGGSIFAKLSNLQLTMYHSALLGRMKYKNTSSGTRPCFLRSFHLASEPTSSSPQILIKSTSSLNYCVAIAPDYCLKLLSHHCFLSIVIYLSTYVAANIYMGLETTRCVNPLLTSTT